MDEEEMGLESNIYVLRSDAATFPSGAHGHPWKAKPTVILADLPTLSSCSF